MSDNKFREWIWTSCSRRIAKLRHIERMFLDAYPDACPEWNIIIGGLK